MDWSYRMEVGNSIRHKWVKRSWRNSLKTGFKPVNLTLNLVRFQGHIDNLKTFDTYKLL